MTLLFVFSAIRPGGAERVISILIDALIDRGHSITLVTLDESNEDFYDLDPAVARVRLGVKRPSTSLRDALRNNVIKVSRLRRAFRAASPDVVVSFTSRINIPVLTAAIGTAIPVVVSERNNPNKTLQGPVWKLLRRLLYPRAACVVAQTRAEARWFSRISSRVQVIGNPVRPVQPVSAQQDGTAVRLLAVGRLEYQKGFDLLLEAFAKVVIELPIAELTIVGEGSRRPELEEQIRALGIAERVRLAGNVKGIEDYYRSADTFVLSSRHEGLPNVLLEAMAHGLPCVSFDCHFGPAEIIQDGQNGILVPSGDTTALAGAIVSLARDARSRRRLSAAAPSAVEAYLPDKVVSKWLTVFKSVAKRR